MISPEWSQQNGEKAVDQLGSSQDSEQHPPVEEEQVELLVPDIGGQDTSQIYCVCITTIPPGMLHAISHSREGLNSNNNRYNNKLSHLFHRVFFVSVLVNNVFHHIEAVFDKFPIEEVVSEIYL